MARLSRAQLATCWVLLLVVSFFILVPAIRVVKLYKYRSKDGWYLRGFGSRSKEQVDESGRCYIRWHENDRKYYYAGSYIDFSLKRHKHPYERIMLVIILNGILLIYTLGGKKPTKTSEKIAQDLEIGKKE